MMKNELIRFPDGTPACGNCGVAAFRLTADNGQWVCTGCALQTPTQPIEVGTKLVAIFRQEVIDRKNAERLQFIDRVLTVPGQ